VRFGGAVRRLWAPIAKEMIPLGPCRRPCRRPRYHSLRKIAVLWRGRFGHQHRGRFSTLFSLASLSFSGLSTCISSGRGLAMSLPRLRQFGLLHLVWQTYSQQGVFSHVVYQVWQYLVGLTSCLSNVALDRRVSPALAVGTCSPVFVRSLAR
jgi:hypothetical protein